MFSSIFLFLNIGGQEMIFIFVIALFLFGGKKLPELARGLGKGIREFKDASETIKRDINDQINDFDKEVTKPTQKALTESPSVPVSEEAADPEESVGVNSDANDDISHSDEYYRHNYDYEAGTENNDAISIADSETNEVNPMEDSNTVASVPNLEKSNSQPE